MALVSQVVTTLNTGRRPSLYRLYMFFTTVANGQGWTLVDVSNAADFLSEVAVLDGSWFVVQNAAGEQFFLGVRDTSGALAGFPDITIPVGLYCAGAPNGGWNLAANNWGANPYSALIGGAERWDSGAGLTDKVAAWVGFTVELHMVADTDHFVFIGRLSSGNVDVGCYAGRYTAFEDVADLPKAFVVLYGQPEMSLSSANCWDTATLAYFPGAVLQPGGADWDTAYFEDDADLDSRGTTYVTAKWVNDNLKIIVRGLARLAGIAKSLKRTAAACPWGQQNAGGTRANRTTLSLPL